MILSMNEQIKLFLLAILIGVATGFIYDIIKTLRKIFAHNNFMVQAEDFLFWLAISLGMFFIMQSKNSGQVRSFVIGGALFGMLVYSLTISKFVVKFSVATVNFVIKIFVSALRIILWPIKLIIKILNVPWNFLKGYLLAIAKFIKKHLYISNRYAKIRTRHALNNLKIIFKKI